MWASSEFGANLASLSRIYSNALQWPKVIWGQTRPKVKSLPPLWVNSRYLLMVDLVVDGEIEQLVTSQVEHIEHMVALLELPFQQCDEVSSNRLLSPLKPKWLSSMPRKTENRGRFESKGLGINGFGLFTWPITGNLLGMGGVCCANWSMKTTIASKIVISKQRLPSN